MPLIDELGAELVAGHPVTGPYDPDPEVANAQIHVVNRTVNKTSLTSSEVFNAIDDAEWDGLTSEQKADIDRVLSLGTLNPFGRESVVFTSVFGPASVTIQALAAMRKTAVSRAVELGLGDTKPGHIMEARA